MNKALKFLEVEAMQLEMDMNNKFQKESNKTVEKIIDSIDSAIQNELYSKVDEIAKIAIAYAQEIANDEKHEIAIKMAKRGYKDISLDKILEIPLNKDIDTDSVLKSMQNYMGILFNDYKNNYLDVKSDLKNSFAEYERNISKIFRQVKDNLNSQLKDALEIDIQTIEMQTIDIDSTLGFNVSIPDSVLSYKYQKAEYRTESTSR